MLFKGLQALMDTAPLILENGFGQQTCEAHKTSSKLLQTPSKLE
jgi:hypothetical protein